MCESLEVPSGATSIDFLMAIYRDRRQPMNRRMKAAIETAPFCHPQLKAIAVIVGGDFATRLDRAIRGSRGELIEAQAVDESIR
jgi:hypothetical protein